MIFVHTLGYNRHEFVRAGIEYFQAHSDPTEYDRHVLFDPGYPLPSREENSDELRRLAAEKGIEYVRIENLGCHKNWDWVAKNYCWGDDDVIVGVCPDARGGRAGWIRAGVEVMKADPRCFCVQLNRHGDYAPYGPEVTEVGGHAVIGFPGLVAWSVGIFRMKDIKLVGGFDAYSSYYGWGEHWLVDRLVPMGKRWYFLRDFFDEGGAHGPDPEYLRWKELSAARRTQIPFDVWLAAGRPE
jgi:hypothetical protein